MSATLDSIHLSFPAGASSAAPGTRLDEPAAAPARALPVLGAMLGGLLAGSMAFGLDFVRPGPSQPLAVVVGSTPLTVPRALLRTPGEGRSGVVPRLDLRLTWPGMNAVSTARAGTAADDVSVAIVAADDSPAPETRVSTLYARFLEPQVLEGPGDLLTRHFKKASPYAGEVLVFSPPDGRRIAARCDSGPARPAAPAHEGTAAAEIPASCIAEIRRGGLDIQIRFEPRLAGGLEVARQNLVALVDKLAR